ncbi:MAG: flagellar hook-associated protein FlgK [Schwartzia sp.]|nr:flagellar hook-associated protein FlgK [Schwartzia sp. (in: firmicutes)]
MAVRSTFAGLNTMYRGVSTNRLALETVGHNITNANAEGYSRQNVNQAAVMADAVYTNGIKQYIGAGNDAMSITRARDIYADKQYWREYGDQEYFDTRRINYDKLEVIFDDSDDTGVKDALDTFYQSWVDLSATASSTSERIAVLERGRIVSERFKNAGKQLQEQIKSEYDDLRINIGKVNELTDQLVQLNKSIMSRESTGGMANDLRDARDRVVDELSGFLSVTVSESAADSMYTLVSNGVSLVNGITKLDLTLGPKDSDGNVKGVPNPDYGVTDYNIELDGTGVVFDPLTGVLRAEQDAIAEDKSYIDQLADMAAFLLTDFNAQHKAGAGMDVLVPNKDSGAFPATGLNFFGEDGVAYLWNETSRSVQLATQTVTMTPSGDTFQADIVTGTAGSGGSDLKGINIINALMVTTTLSATDGERKIAARSIEYDTTDTVRDMFQTAGGTSNYTIKLDGTNILVGGTADGSNAVLLGAKINMGENGRTTAQTSIGSSSMTNYYRNAMTQLGVDSESMQAKVAAQEDVVEQVAIWRSETAGVNWDEELTNMIMFQTGYSACSRCLTAMDEMLDRLINSTGMVGR